jgi:hypothetical protein
MSDYGITRRSIMCNPKVYTSNFAAISKFMISKIIIIKCVLLRICSYLQEKQFPAITPPRQDANSLILSVVDASTLKQNMCLETTYLKMLVLSKKMAFHVY